MTIEVASLRVVCQSLLPAACRDDVPFVADVLGVIVPRMQQRLIAMGASDRDIEWRVTESIDGYLRVACVFTFGVGLAFGPEDASPGMTPDEAPGMTLDELLGEIDDVTGQSG